METLIHAVRIYSQDVGMKFGIEKCAMLEMKSDKEHLKDGMELQNQEKKLERSEKRKRTNTWGYWKLKPSNKLRWKKIKKEYLRKTRKLLKTKLYNWNLLLIRYSGLLLKGTGEELKQMDQRIRKLMPMH